MNKDLNNMSVNKHVFCNTPWYEIHIYWDGSFGICCQESHKLYAANQQYNITNMSIQQWFNSEPAKKFRLDMFNNNMHSACSTCRAEEQHGGHSRRIRSNQKSVIFMSAFEPSFNQSPGHKHFEYSKNNSGHTNTLPIDLHIDLGNFCNLACKMCNARASSTIAGQHVKWNIVEDRKYLGQDWTKDELTWNNFKQQLLDIPNLNNIHFMGGETLLTDKLEDLVDTMIKHKRFDLCFSFVTNGTVYKPKLIKKLKQFRRVGIEISIETVDDRNSYIRQGTDTEQVLKNIELYKRHCDNSSVTVTLRPAPSFLSIGSHVGLLEYALKQKLIVKTNFCNDPKFLDIKYLPAEVKKLYKEKYQLFVDRLADVNFDDKISASNPNNYQAVLKHHALTCLDMLDTPTPTDAETQHKQLVEHCGKWDKVYKLDARKLYPELVDIWDKYDY